MGGRAGLDMHVDLERVECEIDVMCVCANDHSKLLALMQKLIECRIRD